MQQEEGNGQRKGAYQQAPRDLQCGTVGGAKVRSPCAAAAGAKIKGLPVCSVQRE